MCTFKPKNKHKDIWDIPEGQREQLLGLKEGVRERLARMLVEEEEAHKKEMARRQKEIDDEKRALAVKEPQQSP